jgi:hypothetical protein
MSEPYTPCQSCPYRKDAPIGLWDPIEFQNLLKTERDMLGSVFACHGEAKKPTKERALCAGWLLDQKARNLPSIRLRILLSSDERAADQFNRVCGDGLDLFNSVEEMCVANGVGSDGQILFRLPPPRKPSHQ